MKPDEIAELRRLEAKATPGPWAISVGQDNLVVQAEWPTTNVTLCSTYDTAAGRVYPRYDSALIVAARNALPRLLAERETLVEALRAALAANTAPFAEQTIRAAIKLAES